MKREVRIEVKHVSKFFNKGIKKTILEKVLQYLRLQEKEDEIIKAVEDVSFNVKAGEIVGVIGRNGSGKSTLLRLVAGIYPPTTGKIKTRGKMIYLSGFSYGLNGKLTMRENIYSIATIMGLDKKEIGKRFDKIVRFSGLANYLDMKVKKFSDGMRVRLATSVGLHCIAEKNPDILLVDEVLGSGADESFRTKASRRMKELLRKGASVILVSHNMGIIRELCHRVILLEDGKIIMDGKAKKVIETYLKRKRFNIT